MIHIKDLKLIQKQLLHPEECPEFILEHIKYILKDLKDDILEYEEDYTISQIESIEKEYNTVKELALNKLNITIEPLYC